MCRFLRRERQRKKENGYKNSKGKELAIKMTRKFIKSIGRQSVKGKNIQLAGVNSQ
jgi:hypothetical protein